MCENFCPILSSCILYVYVYVFELYLVQVLMTNSLSSSVFGIFVYYDERLM